MNQKRITNQILNQKNFTLNSTLNYLFNISNMKKLFSYLLISSMVVLSSCTNYDDQFDDLNSQINTLKSQIEGFSSLSSGLTALQGTVASLQTAIANIPVTPATDLSGLEATQAALQTGLTDLADAVAALKTQLDGAATADDVAALQTALTAAQADLDDLLKQNNIYSTAVSITTVAELEFAVALGDKLNIVNSTVDIDQTADMDAAVLQTVMSKIKTVTGNVEFEATETGITTTPSFDELTSAADLKIEQKADVSLPELKTLTGALNIVDDNKITSIVAPKLTKVGSITNSTFNKVSMFDMSSLVRLPAALTLSVDSGTVDFSSLITTTDATPVAESGFKIQIDGATIVKAPLITGGELSMNSVLEPNFPVWEGKTGSAFAKATKAVFPKITGNVAVNLSTFAPRATYFHMIGNEYNDATDTTDNSTFPTFTLGTSGNDRLETLIIGGDVKSVNVTGASDLTSYTHTGSTQAFTFENNDAMTSLVLGYDSTMNTGTKGAAKTTGTLSISGNSDLTSVTGDLIDDITSFTIEDNPELDTISFKALNSVGAATAAVVKIEDNDLVIDNIQRASATGVSPVVALQYKSADFGPLKAFFDAAIAKVGTTGSVLVSADDVIQETSAAGDVTEDPGAVDDADHVLVNYDPSVKSNAVGSKAMVEEFTFTNTGDATLTVGNYVSTIKDNGGTAYYDLLTWAADATETANLSAAGVTVTVGKGQYTGQLNFATGSTLTGSTYYEISVAGEDFTGTTGAASGHTVLSLVNTLHDQISTDEVISATKQFNIYTTTTGLVFSGTAKGSAASTWSIGNLAAYTTASKTTPVTTATGTVTGPARIETSGYIRVTSKEKGTANAITSTLSAGDGSKLTVSGTHTGASSTGDDENVVAPDNGTDSTVTAAQVTAARKDLTAYLAS